MRLKILLILFLIAWMLPDLRSQDPDDTQEFLFSAEDFNSVGIYNYRGPVQIKGIDGDIGKVRSSRTLSDRTQHYLNSSNERIFLDTLWVDGNLFVFVDAPDRIFKVEDGSHAYYEGWNRPPSGSKLRHFKLDYEFSLVIEIPRHLKLEASTHEKRLEIENFSNDIIASNHHDDITLVQVSGNVKASTHHGNIQVNFSSNPPGSIKCSTHHGDIKVEVNPGLSADVHMESHHGSLFTDFDCHPVPLQVSTEESGKGTKYRWGSGTNVRIGQGDLEIDFDTHHGDAYIIKKNN